MLRGIGLGELLRHLLAPRRDEADGPRSETEAAVRALADMIEKMVTERAQVAAPAPPTSEAVEFADLPILTAAADELDALRRAVRPLARRIAPSFSSTRKQPAGSIKI